MLCKVINTVVNNSIFINQLKLKYNLDENDKHIIFVGSPHYRKNLKTVLKVLEKVNKSHPNIKLLVISHPRNDIPLTLESYQKIEQSNQAILLSKIPREDIIGLLTLSDLLLNPTLEEGFGLPNIEAQICGTPVVSSNVSCIPEVLGDSAVLIDPLNVKLISDSCVTIIENENLRNDLVKKGFKNVQKYNDLERYNSMLELFDKI
jgi:glycosyltransferase involved in cell wall biosynthesis